MPRSGHCLAIHNNGGDSVVVVEFVSRGFAAIPRCPGCPLLRVAGGT
jgi:hypothetical protein